MTTAEGIAFVYATLREDPSSDRLPLSAVLQAANLGYIDLFHQTRCAKETYTVKTAANVAQYPLPSNMFDVLDKCNAVTFNGQSLPHGAPHNRYFGFGVSPRSWHKDDAFSITLTPAPVSAGILTVTGHVTPSSTDATYPLLVNSTGSFQLTAETDAGPWYYAVVNIAATILADDAGAQSRAQSCVSLYQDCVKKLAARLWQG